MENPSDYTESTKYLSWERYFTHVLEEHTKGTELEYHKKKLNKQYLYARATLIQNVFRTLDFASFCPNHRFRYA